MRLNKQFKKDAHYFSEHLTSKLSEIRAYRTTIVEAPSGYGKTTALRAYYSRCIEEQLPAFWFAAEDEKASKSWERFCKELTKVDGETGLDLLHLGFPEEDNVGEIVEKIHRLSAEEEIYLFADNFHYLKNNLPNGVWNALIEHLGEKIHFIFILQNVNTQNTITNFGPKILKINRQDFCFTKPSIKKYFALAGIELSESQVELLERDTEGWIVALYLQMINYTENGGFAFASSIYQLIEETVWINLKEYERELLLSLTYITRFTLKQWTYMTQAKQSKQVMENLIQNISFIQYHIETKKYVIHYILREFLKIKFSEQEKEFQRTVYLRAAEWSQETGDKIGAIKNYYQIKEFDKILALNLSEVELAQEDELINYKTIWDILSNASFEEKSKHPVTLIQMALEIFSAGMYEEFIQICNEIEVIISNLSIEVEQKNRLFGELTLLRSFLDFNDIEKMSTSQKKAYELIRGTATSISMNETWTFGAPSVLYMFYRESGKLEYEVDCLEESLPYYAKLTKNHGMGGDLVMRAEAFFYQGNLEKAEIYVYKASYIADLYKQESIYLCAVFLLARIAMMNANVQEYQGAIKKMEESLGKTYKKSMRMTIQLMKAYFTNAFEEPELAEEWIKSGDINPNRLFDVTIPYAQMIYLKNLLLRQEYRKVIAYAEVFLQIAEELHFLLVRIYDTIYLAHAYYLEGHILKATELMKEAYELAMPDHLYLPFAENSEFLEELLVEKNTKKDKEEYAQIRQLSEKYNIGKITIHKKIFQKELPFGLSEREYEVAKLASSGYQNKEIAIKLFVSENTVKQYLKIIFQKLQITQRSDLRNKL